MVSKNRPLEELRGLLTDVYITPGLVRRAGGRMATSYADFRALAFDRWEEVAELFPQAVAAEYGPNVALAATGVSGALLLAAASLEYSCHLWNPKGHGKDWSPKPPKAGEVVLVDDVRTTGGTLAALRDAVTAAGAIVKGDLVLFDWGQHAPPRLVYLASPYTHLDEGTVERRYERCVEAVARLSTQGHVVFSPVVHFHVPAKTHGLEGTWEFWERVDKVMIDKSDEVWVLDLPGWMASVGVTAEVEYAKKEGKPVFLIDSDTFEPVDRL